MGVMSHIRKWERGVVVTSLGNAHPLGAQTIAAYVNLEGTGSRWFFARNNGEHSAGEWFSFGSELSAGGLRLYIGPPPSPSMLPTNGHWCLCIAGKEAGDTHIFYSIYDFTTEAWTHHESNSTTGDKTATSDTSIQFGRWNVSEELSGLYAACVIWGKHLTTAEREALLTGHSSVEGWLSTEPLGMWFFNQALVTEAVQDLTGGGANQTSRSGTSVVEVEIPFPLEGEEVEEQVISPTAASSTFSAPEPQVTNEGPEESLIAPSAAASAWSAPGPTIANESHPEIVIAPDAALLTASMASPTIVTRPNAGVVTFSVPEGAEAAAGPMPSPTNDGRTGGLPLPFPSVLANPGRLGPPRFSAADRKALRL